MRRGSFVQTVTDIKKVNLRKFPTRKYKNCRIFRSIFWINTHVLTQEMHNDYIRLFIYHNILGGGLDMANRRILSFSTLKPQGSSGHHGCCLDRSFVGIKNMIINAIPLGLNI